MTTFLPTLRRKAGPSAPRTAGRSAPRTAARPAPRRTASRWIALPAIVVAALIAAGFVVQASGREERPPRFVVVVDASAGRDAATVEAATAAVRSAGGDLRITRTPTEQLSVTSYFAARGYDAVVGVGLDRRIAVAPVAARYPDVRFAHTDADGLAAAVASATTAR